MTSNSPDKARSPSCSRDPKIFYFVFTEGCKTEILYFNELSKSEIIKESIEIKVMDRCTANIGDSNQYHIVKNVTSFIENASRIPKKSRKAIKKLLDKIVDSTFCLNDMMELQLQLQEIKKKGILDDCESIPNQIDAILTMSDYDNNYDKICVIIDRDSGSFSKDKYDEVISIASKQKYLLGISNPCFEFFLVLHISDCQDVDENDLLQNAKITSRKRFTEDLLSKEMIKHERQYNKNKYDCEFLINNIRVGIENSKSFESGIQELKDKAGTSVFLIIENILKSD
jgi:hypothetical protein